MFMEVGMSSTLDGTQSQKTHGLSIQMPHVISPTITFTFMMSPMTTIWYKAVCIDHSKKLQVLWPVKYCTNAGANLYSLQCKLLKGDIIKKDHKNKIAIQSFNGDIIQDH